MAQTGQSASMTQMKQLGVTVAACAAGAIAMLGLVTLQNQQSKLDDLTVLVAQMQQAPQVPVVPVTTQANPQQASQRLKSAVQRTDTPVAQVTPASLPLAVAANDTQSARIAAIMAQTGMVFEPGALCISHDE